MGINYGLNKVRFTAPVPVNSRLRAHMHLLACESIDNNGMQMTWKVSVEREGSDKPVCVAESLVRRYPKDVCWAKPFCRHASYTVMATALERFKLRCPASMGKRSIWSA